MQCVEQSLMQCPDPTPSNLVHGLLRYRNILNFVQYTDIKENQIFLIYKEIRGGAVAKSYMKKGFLIY
jgi:hypothetical protein